MNIKDTVTNFSMRTMLLVLTGVLFCGGIPLIVRPDLFLFIPEAYFFFGCAAAFFLISLFAISLKKELTLSISWIDVFAGAFFIYTIANALITQHIDSSYQLLAFIAQGGIYLVVRALTAKEGGINGLVYALMFAGTVELVAAYLQYAGVLQNLQPNMPFGGSFANPAPFAIFMACTVPLVLHRVLNDDKWRTWSAWIKIIYLALSVAIIVISQIRSAWIGMAIGISIVLLYRYRLVAWFVGKTKVFRISIVALVISGIITSAVLLFTMKKESAIGRLFVWKMSTHALADNPVFGAGFGNFIYAYNHAQADYFHQGHYTEDEFLVADDIKMAYNDLLQMAVETGAVGVLLFLALIFAVTHIVRRYAGERKEELIALLAVLAVILVAGWSSYPLTILKLQLVMVVCLAVIGAYALPISKYQFTVVPLLRYGTWISSLAICCLLCIYSIQQLVARGKWADGLQKYMSGDVITGFADMRDASNVLGDEPDFMINYASVLLAEGKIDEVQSEWNRMDLLYNDYSYYMLKADFYMNIKNFIRAEIYLHNALDIQPSRFIPRNSLMICYTQLGKQTEAVKMANEILTMPIKVYDQRVEAIQNGAKKFLGVE